MPRTETRRNKERAEDFEKRLQKVLQYDPTLQSTEIRTIDQLRAIQYRQNKQKKREKALKQTDEFRQLVVVTDAVQKEAYEWYMRFTPVQTICKLTGMTAASLQLLIHGEDGVSGWKLERDTLHKELKEGIKQGCLKVLQETVAVGATLILSAFKGLAEKCALEKREATLYEANIIGNILAKVHRAKILEEIEDGGEKKIALGPEEILEQLGKDPYTRRAIIMAAEASEAEMQNEELLEQEEIDQRLEKDDGGSLAHTDR